MKDDFIGEGESSWAVNVQHNQWYGQRDRDTRWNEAIVSLGEVKSFAFTNNLDSWSKIECDFLVLGGLGENEVGSI